MTQRITPTLRRISPLLALVALTLVPYGWLAQELPWLQPLVYGTFDTEEARAVGHTLIFLVIGAALLRLFPALAGRPGLYLGLILLIGVGQEAFQLLYKGRGLAVNDFTDLGIDLVAASLALALARAARRKTREGAGDVL